MAVTAGAPALHGAVTEALKVGTVRRNLVAATVAAAVVVAQPWAFLGAFGWLAGEGVASSSLEVLGLSSRNQAAGFLLLLLLGQQAYLSDAGHGLLQPAVAGRRGRSGTAVDKLLLGVLTSAVLAFAATLSAYAACRSVGPDPWPRGAEIPLAYWPWSWLALTTALTFYFLLGLLIATLVRSKALSVVSGVVLVWVVVPAVLTVVGMSTSAAGVLRWLLPTELAAAVLAWVPGGNSLVADAGPAVPRAVLLLAWVTALAVAWLVVLRRRQFYPSDAS